MRWFHQAHFFLWGRGDLAQRSDGYFNRSAAIASWHTRERQGYRGVRWPKMVGPPELMEWPRDELPAFRLYSGPSDTGSYLLWQQPQLEHSGLLQYLEQLVPMVNALPIGAERAGGLTHAPCPTTLCTTAMPL